MNQKNKELIKTDHPSVSFANSSLREGWEIKKLGDVCDIINGTTPLRTNKEFWEGGDFPWFTIDDIREQGRLINYTKQKVTLVALKKLRILPIETILLCCTASIGEYALTKIELTSNQQFNGLVIKDKKELYPMFLLYFSSTLKDILSNLSGKATIDFIPISRLRDIEIPILPLPEQQRIVAKLDQIFAAIDKAKANAEQNLKNAKELFESYLQEVFEKKGEGWEEKTLGEVATFRNGMNFTKGSKGEEIKIVGVKDFKNSFWVPFENLESVIIDGKLSNIDLLNENDILVVRSNGNPALIGRTLLSGNFVGKVSHSGFTIRIRINTNILNPLYLCHYLKTNFTRKKLMESGTGVNIKSLNQGSLSSLLIKYPKSIETQQVIVQKLDALSAETKRLELLYQKKMVDLEELRKSVLQKAFSGQL